LHFTGHELNHLLLVYGYWVVMPFVGLESFNGLSPESEAQIAPLISCKSVCCEISMEVRVHPGSPGSLRLRSSRR
jgi:hypothetical protein